MTTVKNTRKAPSRELLTLMGKQADAKRAILAWREAGSRIDLEHAPALLAAAVRIASAKHGEGLKTAITLGITESNEASRFAGAWKASLAFSVRNGTPAPDAFPTFFVMAKNVSNTDMLAIARESATLAIAAKSGKEQRATAIATRKARPNTSVADGTEVSKASNGKTGNAHGGTGDTSATKNGDTGDKASDTLASRIRSVTASVSDAIDNGTLKADDLRALSALESVIVKARKAGIASKATANK